MLSSKSYHFRVIVYNLKKKYSVLIKSIQVCIKMIDTSIDFIIVVKCEQHTRIELPIEYIRLCWKGIFKHLVSYFS